MGYMAGSLLDLGRNIIKMDEHCEFLFLLAQMSDYCIEYFNGHKLAHKLVHLLCQDETPLKGELPDFNFHPAKRCNPINTLNKLVHLLVVNADMSSEMNRKVFGTAKWYKQVYQ